jgi:glycosyltransferase involved in cell wall biosynthesis
MITGYDIVCLSTQDWDALPTRKHRFMRWFAEAGNRVLYVEQQMHWLGWLAEIRCQFSRLWCWMQPPRRVAPDVWVSTLPLVLPFFQMSAPINRLNNALLIPFLRWQMRRLGFERPILWTYTPHSADFIGRLGERLAVYECVDEFTASRGLVSPRVIGGLERELIRAVDLVSVTAPALYERKRGEARRIVLVPNGAEVEHFRQAADPSTPVAPALEGLPRPIVGFLGTIQYWIDTALIARLAREHPDWSVVLVGPSGLLADLAPLKNLPNVHMIGQVDYQDLPAYLRAFDVCLNPYRTDGVAEACSPIKLYEYLASGKPIVSVDMPEARTFDGLVRVARDADDFIAQVEAAIAEGGAGVDARLAEAGRHSWRARFEQVCRALESTLAEKEGAH